MIFRTSECGMYPFLGGLFFRRVLRKTLYTWTCVPWKLSNDEILPSYVVIIMNHDIRIPIKQPGWLMESIRLFQFSCLLKLAGKPPCFDSWGKVIKIAIPLAYTPWNWHSPWKWWFPIGISFSMGLFSVAMLVSGRVNDKRSDKLYISL